MVQKSKNIFCLQLLFLTLKNIKSGDVSIFFMYEFYACFILLFKISMRPTLEFISFLFPEFKNNGRMGCIMLSICTLMSH